MFTWMTACRSLHGPSPAPSRPKHPCRASSHQAERRSDAIRAASFTARVGEDVDTASLERYFAVNGYVRASTVSERGEFAVRGGVIDVFPPGAEEPVRLDLFGDTLEQIRGFDPETQRSTATHKSVDLLPVSEALLDKETISRFRTGFVRAFGVPGDDALYAAVSEGGRRAGMEHWLPLFYPRLETVFDYAGPDALVLLDHLAAEARDERIALVEDAHDSRLEASKVRGGSNSRPLPAERFERWMASYPLRTTWLGEPPAVAVA